MPCQHVMKLIACEYIPLTSCGQGDYGLTLFEVPLRDEAERHEVTEKDVREWLIFAILEEDRKGRRLSARIAQIEVRVA